MAKITKKTPVKATVKKTIKATKPAVVAKKPAVTSTPTPVLAKEVLVKYFDKNIKISPRKLTLAVDRVRPLKPTDCLNRLKFTNNKASKILFKAITNVIADAKHNFNLQPESLVFDSIFVGEGLKIKRLDKSHGSRFARGLIQKRHSRLTIIVKSKN